MKSKKLLVLICLAMLLTTTLFVRKSYPQQKLIPKRIYTFWHEEPHGLIEKFINNWAKHNPAYEIIILNHTNYQSHINSRPTFDFDSLIIQHQTDWIRLAMLAENGGYWIDASVLLTNSLDTIENIVLDEESEGFAFNLKAVSSSRTIPILDNFFIASHPKSVFLTNWFEEYTLALSTDYLKNLETYYSNIYEEMCYNIEKDKRQYYLANISSQKLLYVNQLQPLSHRSAANIILGPDESSAISTAKRFLDEWKSDIPIMLKLTHQIRDAAIELINSGYPIHQKSLYSQYL